MKRNWVPQWKQFPVPQKLTPFAVDSRGIPSDADCNSIDWSLSYLTMAVGNAFGRLYNNYDNLGDSFAAYWKKLATEYASTPNILGYNLLNEPWVGDTWADPTLVTPGVADHKVMEALWNRANTQIRLVDQNTLVFFEGATLDVLSGFNNVPGGDGSKTVHSFHYYNPPQLGTIEDTIKNRIKDNLRLKTAAMLTEVEFWQTDAKGLTALHTATDTADKYMMSWMGWYVLRCCSHQHILIFLYRAYENLYDTTTNLMRPELASEYSRAYASAVAGVPTSFGFNRNDSSFTLTYKVKKSITAPTELILPVPTYPNGYNVTFSPSTAGLVQYKADDRTLAIFNGDNTPDGQSVTITITKL